MGSPMKLGILLLRCSFLLVEELLPKACGRRKQKFLGVSGLTSEHRYGHIKTAAHDEGGNSS